MSQIFHLRLATDTIVEDAKQLGVTVKELNNISVIVSADIINQPTLYLQLTYQIALPTQSLIDQLNWPTWQSKQVGFADYLWEATCLECFVASHLSHKDAFDNSVAPYVEINASPDGRYALYQFDSYRSPATLPPTPLSQTDRQTRACIDWQESSGLSLTPTTAKMPTQEAGKLSHHPLIISKPIHSEPSHSERSHFKRSFSVPLTQLVNKQHSMYGTVIEHIHPCVILLFGKAALYFAARHASPPDFHNRQYWSKFEL